MLGRAQSTGRQRPRQRLAEVERDWQTRFGERTVAALRESLEALTGAGPAGDSPLFRGLDPYPDGWRWGFLMEADAYRRLGTTLEAP